MSKRDSIRVEYVTQKGEERVIYPDGDVILNPANMEGVAVKVFLDPEPESGAIVDRRTLIIPWGRIVELERKPDGFKASELRRQRREEE